MVSLHRSSVQLYKSCSFNLGDPKYTSDTYPDDLDTTSLGLLTIPPDPAIVHSVLDEMHDYIDEDGNVQVCIKPLRHCISGEANAVY